MSYVRFLTHRLAFSVVVLIGLSILIFIIARIIPGDPVRLALGTQIAGSEEQVQRLRERMHLDDPIYLQYYYYVSDLLQGDFGISLYTGRDVLTDIRDFFPATFELILYAGLFMVLLGIPLGIFAARFKDTWIDNTIRLAAFLGVVTPSFVWAILLQLFFSYWVHLLPVAGRFSFDQPLPTRITGLLTVDSLIALDWGSFKIAFQHLILPAVSLSLAGMAQTMRMTRANILDVAGKAYIEASRVYGLPEALISFKYMLKPSMIPTMTILGLDFVAMLGNAFLVEQVFNWPGLARYGVQVVLHKDLNAIVGVVMVIGFFFVAVNFLIDILVGYLDPRIRLRETGRTG